MLTANQTFTLLSTGATKTFQLTGQDLSSASRIDTSSTLATPRLMVIRHNVTAAKSGPKVDRHLVQFSEVELDDNNNPSTAYINVVYSVPRAAVWTPAKILDLVKHQLDFHSTSGVPASLLLGDR